MYTDSIIDTSDLYKMIEREAVRYINEMTSIKFEAT